MGVVKRYLFFILIGLSLLNPILAFAQNQTVNSYPKTYEEAINSIIAILDNRTKTLIKESPKFATRQFAYIIHNNHLINYKDNDFLASCAKSIGKPYVHFEDVTNVILVGVWDKLNSDLELIDFEKIKPEDYFPSIQNTLIKGIETQKNGYFASLPCWLYHNECYGISSDSLRNSKLLLYANRLIEKRNQNSYLGLLYLSQCEENLEKRTQIIQKYYTDEPNYFEIPSYKYIYENKKRSLKKDQPIIGIEYAFNKISYKELALRCYGIIYDKNFTSIKDFEVFINYCNTNYLAEWKFLKTLSLNDYKLLINQPRKLLEILILTKKYYFKNSGYNQLIESSNENIDDLISYIETKYLISTEYPYHIRLQGNFHFEDEKIPNRDVNALKLIANKLCIEEIFDIINPKSIENYNKTLKTDDFLEYKDLISFILASQYERFLSYQNKDRVFEICYYYWEHEHVSWPFEYFVTDLLIQIDNKKAIEIFKKHFNKNPTKGSFTRQAILNSIIEYDFESNSKFIEDWYWLVQDKNFNYKPDEHQFILDLLKEKDGKTLNLYNKIITDNRYRP